MRGFHRVNVLGCPFDAISFCETVESIRGAIRSDTTLQIVPGSVDFIIKARRDPEYARLLWDSDLVIADGKPIVWLASLLGDPIRRRVSGTDLVWACAEVSQELDCSVALLGGIRNAASRAGENMMARFPRARLHSIETPFPLDAEASEHLARKIQSLDCKIVLMALGAPRQERWVREYLPKSGANVGIGIGSAFDIICGDRPRAPQWMQDAGMEWFYRMMQEPRRLGRRYLIDDMRVFGYLAAELFYGQREIGGEHE
jgi:N-acetylglucosaminyldiphosphoundecaprenol N-acetyl-beta-D-mannosaminyltransferase